MIVIWTIAVIAVLLLSGSAVIFILRVRRIKRLKSELQEVFYRRLNLIPLLVETSGVFDPSKKDKIIGLRQQLTGDPFNSALTKELKDALVIDSDFKKSVAILTLEKELREIQREIDVSLNDYNLAVQKYSWWFGIFRLAVKIDQNPIAGL